MVIYTHPMLFGGIYREKHASTLFALVFWSHEASIQYLDLKWNIELLFGFGAYAQQTVSD